MSHDGGSGSEILFEGRHVDLRSAGGWEYASRRIAGGVVGVIAVTDADELVLVEQHRKPVGRRVIELPAGLVGDEGDETVLEAAARELEEETGFKASDHRVLWSGPSSAGITDEVTTIVLAERLARVGEGGGVSGEDIDVHLVPMAALETWLRARELDGVLVDLKIRLVRQALEQST